MKKQQAFSLLTKLFQNQHNIASGSTKIETIVFGEVINVIKLLN